MKIAVFGDSVARGAFDKQGGRVERLKGSYLAGGQQHYAHGVYNFSLSGGTSTSLLVGFEVILQWFSGMHGNNTLIILNIGSNDATGEGDSTPNITLEDYKQNVEKLCILGNNYSQKILLMGMSPIDETHTLPMSYGDFWLSNHNQKTYNAVLQSLQLPGSVEYIDTWDWIDISCDLDDGVHPNTLGHEKIFKKMKAIIDDLI